MALQFSYIDYKNNEISEKNIKKVNKVKHLLQKEKENNDVTKGIGQFNLLSFQEHDESLANFSLA